MSFAILGDMRVQVAPCERYRLRVTTWGSGAAPHAVVLPGISADWRALAPQIRALRRLGWTVHVVDLPGHGRSGTPGSRPSIASFSNALGGWLDGARLRSPAFVANSMGCQIVTDFAVREPWRVGTMVLIGPTVDPSRRSARHQVMAALRDLAREPTSLVALSLCDDVGVGLPTLVALARSALADAIEERLPSIEQPTTIVRGADDAFSSDEWVREAVRLLPQGRLVTVPESRCRHHPGRDRRRAGRAAPRRLTGQKPQRSQPRAESRRPQHGQRRRLARWATRPVAEPMRLIATPAAAVNVPASRRCGEIALTGVRPRASAPFRPPLRERSRPRSSVESAVAAQPGASPLARAGACAPPSSRLDPRRRPGARCGSCA